MSVNVAAYSALRQELTKYGVTLVAVSKTKPVEAINELYELGQRDFGENYVQELVEKQALLPRDIRWHFIGHLQTNKVRYIAPFVHLIHGVDSQKLLMEIDKQAQKSGRVINILLQMHIAAEETKFGLDATELDALLSALPSLPLSNVRICGLMGMASFTSDPQQLKKEFSYLKNYYGRLIAFQKELPPEKQMLLQPDTLSMGMSSDYALAIGEGSTMVRIGSLLFGAR